MDPSKQNFLANKINDSTFDQTEGGIKPKKKKLQVLLDPVLSRNFADHCKRKGLSFTFTITNLLIKYLAEEELIEEVSKDLSETVFFEKKKQIKLLMESRKILE
jgi:hypothetical protein